MLVICVTWGGLHHYGINHHPPNKQHHHRHHLPLPREKSVCEEMVIWKQWQYRRLNTRCFSTQDALLHRTGKKKKNFTTNF
jgi:hypothetical protein